METIYIPCTEDKDTEIIIKSCDETSDLFVCVNNEYAYIPEESDICCKRDIKTL